MIDFNINFILRFLAQLRTYTRENNLFVICIFVCSLYKFKRFLATTAYFVLAKEKIEKITKFFYF